MVPGPAARATSRSLIGRQEALARLDRALTDAVEASRVGTVLVEGPAGIGKSRTVEEFRNAVQAAGGEVLVGRCVSLGEEIFPYAPDRRAPPRPGRARRRGRRTPMGRAGLAGAGPAGPRARPGRRGTRRRLRPASAGCSRRAASCSTRSAAEQPLVLVIEDLHWADRSTRELLALLAHQLRGGILLVLTLRTDEAPRDPGVVRLTAELGRRTHDRVVLEPLTRDEQAHQISDILGVPPTRSLLDQVYARAEGNPFFAEELLALRGGAELPPTVRDLLLARLDALAPATRQVLRTGSVIGRTIPHALLETVADSQWRTARVGAAVRRRGARAGVRARRRRLPVPARPAAGVDRREPAARRGQPHASPRRRGARGRPALAGDTSFAAGRVARHWYAAGDGARALVASVDAAREAKAALAFSESLSHFERALVLLETRARRRLAAARSALPAAPACRRGRSPLRQPGARGASSSRAAIAVVDPADQISHAYLHERLGRYLWMAADGQGSMRGVRARRLAAAPGGGPTRWRAAVLSGYSQILMLAGRYEESARLAREAIEVARKALGARSIEGHARNNLGVDLPSSAGSRTASPSCCWRARSPTRRRTTPTTWPGRS